MNVVYKLVFIIVHILFDIFDYFINAIRQIRQKIRKHVTKLKTKNDLLKYYLSHRLIFKKTPSHIAFAILEKDLSFEDLANLVIWCLLNGIPNVTFYEPKGLIKQACSHFSREIVKCKTRFQNKKDLGCKIKLCISGVEDPSSEINSSHEKNVMNVHVNLLSLEDGREDVVNAARTLCSKVAEDPDGFTSSKIDADLVTLNLHALGKFPDPDVLVVFGDTNTVFGFPPWHLRLTEIFSLPSHQDLGHPDFLSILKKYNAIEQRCGK